MNFNKMILLLTILAASISSQIVDSLDSNLACNTNENNLHVYPFKISGTEYQIKSIYDASEFHGCERLNLKRNQIIEFAIPSALRNKGPYKIQFRTNEICLKIAGPLPQFTISVKSFDKETQMFNKIYENVITDCRFDHEFMYSDSNEFISIELLTENELDLTIFVEQISIYSLRRNSEEKIAVQRLAPPTKDLVLQLTGAVLALITILTAAIIAYFHYRKYGTFFRRNPSTVDSMKNEESTSL